MIIIKVSVCVQFSKHMFVALFRLLQSFSFSLWPELIIVENRRMISMGTMLKNINPYYKHYMLPMHSILHTDMQGAI